MRLPRAEFILPVTIVLAGIVLGISEFMTTFELTPPGAEPLDEVTAADQHSYALLMLAIFSVASMMVAVGTGIRVFSVAAAGFGLAALLMFLIIDLPDAGKLGTLGGDSEFTFSTARAEPQLGFVLEAVGSVVLGLAGVAFATLRSDQLRAPLARFGTDEPAAEERDESGPALATSEPAHAEGPRRVPPRERSERPARRTAARPDRGSRNYEPFDFDKKQRNEPAPETKSTSSEDRPGWLSRLRGSDR